MNFDLNEEQAVLADTVGRIFADGGDWRQCLEYGLAALPFAEDVGGIGGGQEEIMLVMEAAGRHLAAVPFWQSVLLAGRTLARAEGEAAAQALQDMLQGHRRHAVCLFEPGRRYRWRQPGTRALRDGDGWRLDGRKLAVPDLAEDCGLIVPASVDGGLGLFLLPAGTRGVTLTARPTPDGRQAGDVALEGVVLPAAAAIGDPAANEALLAEVIDAAILASCAEAIGAMERALELTVEYCNVREQFGAAIGSFQALQHRAADMLIAAERARSIAIYAASKMDAPADERGIAVSAAKAMVNECSRFVGQQAVQLHGGMGLAAESAVGAYFQRLTVLETFMGDTDHHLEAVERGGGLLQF